MENPFIDDKDTKELVSGILFDRVAACEVRDCIFACLDGINTTIDNLIAIPPTNTKIWQEQQQQCDTTSSNNLPTTISTPKTRTPKEKIVDELTQLCATITELTDEDTEAYVTGTLMENQSPW